MWIIGVIVVIVLIAIALILILTTSIYSQVDARFGGFRGGGFGGGGGFFGGFGGGGAKSFSSHSVPLGTSQGKTFTISPSGKISPPQETTQSASTLYQLDAIGTMDILKG